MGKRSTNLTLALATGLLALLVLAMAGVSAMAALGLASDGCNDSPGDVEGCSLPFVWWATASACAGLFVVVAALARPHLQRSLAQRLVALAAGLAVFAVAAYGLIFVAWGLGLAIQTPDPMAPRGEKGLLGGPESWSEVLSAAAWTIVLTPLDLAVLAIAVALLWWSIRMRWLPWRKLAAGPIAGMVLVALIIATSHLI